MFFSWRFLRDETSAALPATFRSTLDLKTHLSARRGGGRQYAVGAESWPAGVPVATVAVGNARNAGLLAVRILAASDEELRGRMVEFQEQLAESAREKGKAVRGDRERRLGF